MRNEKSGAYSNGQTMTYAKRVRSANMNKSEISLGKRRGRGPQNISHSRSRVQTDVGMKSLIIVQTGPVNGKKGPYRAFLKPDPPIDMRRRGGSREAQAVASYCGRHGMVVIPSLRVYKHIVNVRHVMHFARNSTRAFCIVRHVFSLLWSQLFSEGGQHKDKVVHGDITLARSIKNFESVRNLLCVICLQQRNIHSVHKSVKVNLRYPFRSEILDYFADLGI
mmetsp:Transcript_17731/g.30535  ORF Transcript_17731/g.30535 Transcript_17731/m.30535 type:complete len:222 (-) Transcript_17731:246-911(-)